MPALEHFKDVKKKQMILIVGGAIGLVAMLIFGLWFTDPDAGKASKREIAREKAKEVTKNFRARPAVSDEEAWIEKSEETIQKQTDTIKKISQALTTIQDRLEERGIKVRVSSKKNKTSPSTNLPPEGDLPPVTLGDESPPETIDATAPKTDPFAAFPGISPETVNPPGPSQPPPLPNPGQTPGFPPSSQTPPPNLFNPLGSPTPLGKPSSSGNNEELDIQVVTIGPKDKATGKPKEIKNADTYLPAGSFATVRLLSGVDAPTGDEGGQNPIPVLLRVMTDGTLPNFFNSNVSSCHIIASSWGNLASERATIQLETLSCVLLNGDVIETQVKGYVAGEDGKHGLRGRLVSKQGSLVARALLSGLASGFGQALTQQTQQVAVGGAGVVTAIDPNRIAQAGIGSGIGNAMQQISQYYLERARQIFPIIEIAANREGDAILQTGVKLDLPIIANTRTEGEDIE